MGKFPFKLYKQSSLIHHVYILTGLYNQEIFITLLLDIRFIHKFSYLFTEQVNSAQNFMTFNFAPTLLSSKTIIHLSNIFFQLICQSSGRESFAVKKKDINRKNTDSFFYYKFIKLISILHFFLI